MSQPNYEILRKLFLDLMVKKKYEMDYQYD